MARITARLAILFRSAILLLLLSSIDSKKTSSNSHQKSVRVQLNAKWAHTPFRLEVAEYLSEENADYFWSYIDKVQAQSTRPVTDKDDYESSVAIASELLRSDSKVSVLKFALGLRSYSPTVAMFQQMSVDILEQHPELKECETFVELSTAEDLEKTATFSRYNCKIEQLDASLSALLERKEATPLSSSLLYSVDHHFPSGSKAKVGNIILYGQIGTDSFHKIHAHLVRFIQQHAQFNYVVRHYLRTQAQVKPVALSGYGVELAIKSTEYKQQDDTKVRGEVSQEGTIKQEEKQDELRGFIFSKLRDSFPNYTEKLNEFQNYLIDTDKEIAVLKVWELQEISLQAATKVLSVQKEKALAMLEEVSQNFPSMARSLAKVSVESDLKKEIAKNQYQFMQSLSIGTTDAALFVNGLYYDVEATDVFSLFDVIRQESEVIGKLHTLLKGDGERMKQFFKLDTNMDKQDWQIDIRDEAVNYVNDLETDRNYRTWPSSLQEMLRPTYPGMLRSVRKNIFHLVVVIDPTQKASHDVIQMAESFYLYKAPVRIGLVFAVNRNTSVTGKDDAGVACLEAFNYISQERTPYDALSFLTDLIAKTSTSGGDLTPKAVITHFKLKYPKADEEEVFGADSAWDTGRQLAWDYIDRTGIGHPPKALLNGVMLKDSNLNLNHFEDAVLSEIMKQTPPIQKAIYKAELTDSEESVLDWLMNKETVVPRINRVILGMDSQASAKTAQYIDLTGKVVKDLEALDFGTMNLKDLQATVASSVKYANTRKDCNPVTIWLASNFRSSRQHQVLIDALKHLRENSKNARLGFIYGERNVYARVIDAATVAIGNSNHMIQFLLKFLKHVQSTANVNEESLLKAVFDFVPEAYRKDFNERLVRTEDKEATLFRLHSAFSARILNIAGDSDQTVVVLNGKVMRVPEENFIEADFALMEKFMTSVVTDKIVPLLSRTELEAGTRKCSDLVLKISTALLGKAQTKSRYEMSSSLREDHSVLLLEPKNADQPFVELIAILDPLTRGTQKVAPMLRVFSEVFNVRVKIFFNCVEKHSDMPLKSYFRFVLASEPKFDAGNLTPPAAHFTSMPQTPLFTLGMAVPENWMVEAVDAIYDLDNIHLERVENSVVSAVFELEHLLVEGHCFEQSSGTPPRGLQFTLGTNKRPVMFDTIVMANLGYFQLKASPGVWMLKLRQGRSEDIYTIVSHDGGTDHLANTTEVIPVVSNFRSLVIRIRVNKKPGKQNEELLYDSDEKSDEDSENSIWGSLWSSEDGGGKPKPKKEGKGELTADEDEDSKRINIFSLASGHLYERLLRIMMVSVLKNTKTPVKFWFLKNYLSPNFKKVLPYLAERYKFDYELVQYKWPRWLHQQTEKQRIIWGYKILFLDVLFPLNVKKIIFVDADQVVRADLKELRDLDLEGAPYGYTPFCDSRKDMDGFRFWKSGYWATHLHGRKYHISALYVVDLVKFRRIAAGDRLRGQYQGLSQDPNSLSNLDQDLPNNMIHQVAIKSLPQEWLWCETWCDESSKKKAKTIDLCNNPKTKEPKLTGARRIVKEWQDYDNELKALLDEWETTEGKQSLAKGDKTIVVEGGGAAQPKVDIEATKDTKHQEL